jgi:hypothetical protein
MNQGGVSFHLKVTDCIWGCAPELTSDGRHFFRDGNFRNALPCPPVFTPVILPPAHKAH